VNKEVNRIETIHSKAKSVDKGLEKEPSSFWQYLCGMDKLVKIMIYNNNAGVDKP
jgi:hypothetical protein